MLRCTRACLLTITACGSSLAPAVHAQQLLRAVNGAAGDKFGGAVIRAGDQDGDGYQDLLVGAPGFDFDRGRVDCVSGAYLALGSGPITLWSAAPPALAGGALFGQSLAAVGDLTGDGIADFAAGAPGIAGPGPDGTLYLINGASHTVLTKIVDVAGSTLFGWSIDACGDQNGDGKVDVAVGAPTSSGGGIAYVISGARLAAGDTLANSKLCSLQISPAQVSRLGWSIASNVDFDGNGKLDVVVGAPLVDQPGVLDSGAILVFTPQFNAVQMLGTYSSNVAGEHLGESVDAGHDYDGDGVVDIVVGAPNFPGQNNTERGRALVLSGARVITHSPPYELYTLVGSAGTLTPASFHFGAAVRASGDLNNDGVSDFLISSPDFFSTGSPGRGAVAIYSGATGVRIAGVNGASNEHLGDALLGRLQDLDADGFAELVVAGPRADVPATDCGVLECYRLFPCSLSTYCTAKVNSLGCTPAIASSGTPSASSGPPFAITCSNVINQKSGILFYSHQPNASAFQGAFLCVLPPTRRTPVQNSGGSAIGDDCTGSFSFDFGAHIQSHVDPTLVAGAEAFCQYWSRDPLSASTTNLSNALRLLVNP